MLGYLGAISNGTFALFLLIDLIFDGDGLNHKIFHISRKAENLSPGAKLIDDIVNPTPLEEKNFPSDGSLRKTFPCAG